MQHYPGNGSRTGLFELSTELMSNMKRDVEDDDEGWGRRCTTSATIANFMKYDSQRETTYLGAYLGTEMQEIRILFLASGMFAQVGGKVTEILFEFTLKTRRKSSCFFQLRLVLHNLQMEKGN